MKQEDALKELAYTSETLQKQIAAVNSVPLGIYLVDGYTDGPLLVKVTGYQIRNDLYLSYLKGSILAGDCDINLPWVIRFSLNSVPNDYKFTPFKIEDRMLISHWQVKSPAVERMFRTGKL